MRHLSSALAAISAVTLVGLVPGCGRDIGDSCSTNVDCSRLGDRFCDTAQLGGYCTIEGCDVRMNERNQVVDSCENVASESMCVRFFTLEPTRPCRPNHNPPDCLADERCLCDRADPAQVGRCLAPPSGDEAHCAKESSERRWCMLKCNGDGDCRSHYRCVSAGTNGAEPVPRGLEPVAGGDAGLIGVGNYAQKFCTYRPE